MIHGIVICFWLVLCYQVPGTRYVLLEVYVTRYRYVLPGMCYHGMYYVLRVAVVRDAWCVMRGAWWSVFMRFFAR